MENKSESKNNLNESTMPLLDDGTDGAKEKIELKEKSENAGETTEGADTKAAEAEAKKKAKEEEKERKRKQKEEEEQKKKEAKAEKEKKKAEEKEKKKQELEEKKAAKEAARAANGGSPGAGCPRQWNPVDQFAVGVNLLERDAKSVNEHVNVNFEDLMGEVDAAQGFDGAYRMSVGVFEFVRFWFYRLIMPVVAIPFAIVWALIFGVLTLFSVWVFTPAFRVLDIFLYFLHRFWNGVCRTFLDPVFSSIALVRQTPVAFNKTPVATSSGRPIYRETAGYSQVATSDTVTFSKSAEEVTLNIEN